MIPLSTLFTAEPLQWGLRGDPYLWREMRAHFENVAFPESEAQLLWLLEQAFAALTGTALTTAAPVLVERYQGGGMSSGYVSPTFWAEQALPLLRERFHSIRANEERVDLNAP